MTSLDEARRQREWEAQEAALRMERLGAPRKADDSRGGDARVDQYRLIARALREPPLDPAPHDFAALTAARAEGQGAADDRIERWLQNGLLGLLAMTTAAGTALFGRPWLQAIAAALPESDLRRVASWGLAILACLTLSFAFEQRSRRHRPG